MTLIRSQCGIGQQGRVKLAYSIKRITDETILTFII